MTKRGYDVLLVDFEGVLRHWPADDVAIERDCGCPARSAPSPSRRT